MSKLKVDEIRSADRSVSSTANITLADDGNVSLGGTLSAGVIGSAVTQTKPAFHVQAQTMLNLAVDTNTDVQFVTVIKNVGGGTYNTGTYTYTAPVSGLYYISASLHFSGFPNNITDFRITIVTSNRSYEQRYAKYINAEHSSNYYNTFRNSTLADLDANDTVKIQVHQAGGSAQGDLNDTNSYFSGFLVSNY